jgi:hypothetical protein
MASTPQTPQAKAKQQPSKKKKAVEKKEKVATFGDAWKLLKNGIFDLVTHQPFYEAVVDSVVIINAAFVGLEVDKPDVVGNSASIVQSLICVIYISEFALRLFLDFDRTIRKPRLIVEFLTVVVALLGAFAFPDDKLIWRLSAFRCLVRLTRAIKASSRSYRFADLWLVLASWWRSLLALRWLALIFFFLAFFFGGAARGLIFAGEDDDLSTAVCGGDNFRVHLRCIDIDEYFGSITSTMLTMMQLVTLDRWAGHIVRPLRNSARPEAAFFLTCFVFVAFYGLISIIIGVLVWSTVETAKQHRAHRDNVFVDTAKERIRDLKDYFRRCLELEERTLLDLREIKEAMVVPLVKKTYDELELPVTDVEQLWHHLDEHDVGQITLDRFADGCEKLLEPARRFDMAVLSAKLNARSQFAENLEDRCEVTAQEMEVLFKKLTTGFTLMRKHVLSKEVNEIFAEVGMRRAGKMTMTNTED